MDTPLTLDWSQGLDFSTLFDLSNLFVLPFWILMIVVPQRQFSRRILGSLIPFVVLVLLYLYFLSGSLNAETAQALSNPKLADIARFFGDEAAAATGWTHFLVMDLFVGRWIYWEGQRTGIWTRHSIALCLFAGPFGLLSHIVTQWIATAIAARKPEPQSAT
ncbi:ABA4-like family protein [Prochlorothrix hollandica]|uniref:ABA4-like family protein n=1 Tax=Prochlorothrix hollandica TaxID=1223 RepID=UPI00334028C9